MHGAVAQQSTVAAAIPAVPVFAGSAGPGGSDVPCLTSPSVICRTMTTIPSLVLGGMASLSKPSSSDLRLPIRA